MPLGGLALCGLLLGLVPAAMAQKKPVTLELVAGNGSHEDLGTVVWSPDGTHFAYLRGAMLCVYDVNARRETELLQTKILEKTAKAPPKPGIFDWENRRVRERKVQWFPSGSEVLLGVQGDLFVVHLPDGRWEQLTSTSEAERDPKLSPDGRHVSFRRGHELCVLEVASRKAKQLTFDASATRWNAEMDWVYPEELELGTAHWWSPDSMRIAYLQFDVGRQMSYPHADLLKLRPTPEPQRYPQAGTPNAEVRAGIVAARGGKTRWLETGSSEDTLIARLDWLPDSSSLVIQRLNRVQNRLDLLQFSAGGSKMRTLLAESDPYWINIADDLRFLGKTRRFLWSSERDGFRHLYLHSLDGGPVSRLTQGEWELTEVACVDESAGQVFYVSTEVSPLERHLLAVGLDGGARRRVTTEQGAHQVSMSASCSHYLDTFSSLAEPPRTRLHRADGGELAVVRETERKLQADYDILPAEIVPLRSSDGARLYARLIRPAGFRPEEKYPAIVMVYGGPHAQAVRDSWRGADWEQALAHRGFVVWQLDNRGSSGRGHAWEGKLYRRFGAQELADQQEGVRWLISLGFVDPARIGIYGWSYGGFVTLYSLLHAPGLFAAAIAGAPVTDWRNYDTIYTERYLGLPSENEDGYRLSSPVHFAGRLAAPLLLINNIEDDNVLFQNTLQMAAALQKAGKQFDLMLYPQKAHAVTGQYRKHLLELTTAFFERHLR